MDKAYLLKIRDYLEKHRSLGNDFGEYSKLYSMTTENIYGFLNKYDFYNIYI